MRKNWIAVLATISIISTVAALPARKVQAASQTPISRSQVRERAERIVNLTWTYSADKNSRIDTQYSANVTLPKQLQGVTTAQFTGIPYNWGGIDGIDTNSYKAPWTNFLEGVNKGAFTGNVNSKSGIGYVPGTAGMDCSGFAQAAFNIKDYKQSTTTLLNNYFTKIDINDLKPMDILDKPGDHVVIFDKWGTLNGINGAFTYEATPDQTYGGIQGTKRYFISMNTINKGYIPARYNYIIDDITPEPTASTTTATTTSTATTSTTSTTAVTVQASTPQFKTPGYAVVSNVTSFANLRTNPGTSYAILTTFPKGTILNLMEHSNGWYKVNYNGMTGWISGITLGSVPANQYVTVNGVYSLNIRVTPSSTAQIIGVLSQEQYAQKLDQNADGSWFKIRINGIEGWSSSKYLTYIQ